MAAILLPAAAIANEFLERSGRDQRPVTPMQLLKLVYIADGWYLAVTGNPLFEEPVQAWRYGPVVSPLFHEFKEYGGGAIRKLAHVPVPTGDDPFEFSLDAPFVPKGDTDKLQLLEWVWKTYGSMSGIQLSNLTHQPGTPWWNARERMKKENVENKRPEESWTSHCVIPNADIRQHYVDLWNKRNARPA
ncbi:Panacea domain-containing protein [Limnoglobus roseus]|uniref:Antitoxin SocA-like Panacea domain-containing protein n=1 Tax=Limnoglobus roseus TaxID=2598579 RepID=A0A5C1AHA7_9BACT|nr:type II toxin-antitoxin system antitoxin SocA domain-containing protein [Limnoglobus roseus]QEL17547.1 hypothetical protein PX52LOC_04537 [Limnoglobus roseus]